MQDKSIKFLHIGLWIIVVSLNFSFLIFRSKTPSIEVYIYQSIKTLLEISCFYVFYALIAPIIVKQKKRQKFIFVSLISFVVAVSTYSSVMAVNNIVLFNAKSFVIGRMSIVTASYYVFFYMLMGGLFRMAVQGFTHEKEKALLAKQNVESEMSLLRHQINPHFLFNTLNNIDQLIQVSQNKASGAVIKLSDILRYMLYDSSSDMVSLDKELSYISNYIELQRLRYPAEFINFIIKNDNSIQLISPMLLIPFIENAFKHGKRNTDSPGININLTIQDKILHLKVVNASSEDKATTGLQGKGIGLKNVQRRLELMYPDKYELLFQNSNKKYIVDFKLNLT